MGLITSVKLNGIATLHEARYGAGMMVDYLGFPIGTNALNRVSSDTFNEIAGWIQGPRLVVEDPVTAQDLVGYDDATAETGDAELAAQLVRDGICSVAFREKHGKLPTDYDLPWDDFEYVLLQAPPKEELGQWLNAWGTVTKVLLGFGIDQDNVLEMLDAHPILYGVALDGASEEKTGINDFDLVDGILERLDQ